MINPFDPNSKTKQELEKLDKEVQQELNFLQQTARDILNDERYKKFTEIFKEGEKNLINLLIEYRRLDLKDRYKKLDEYLIELEVYRKIINAVDDLANPKPQPKPNFVSNFKKNMHELIENVRE